VVLKTDLLLNYRTPFPFILALRRTWELKVGDSRVYSLWFVFLNSFFSVSSFFFPPPQFLHRVSVGALA